MPTDKIELIEAKPRYARVRYPDGKQDTVFLRDVAPAGNEAGPVTEQKGYAMSAPDTSSDDSTDNTHWSTHEEYLHVQDPHGTTLDGTSETR